jgi:hypothetical protein
MCYVHAVPIPQKFTWCNYPNSAFLFMQMYKSRKLRCTSNKTCVSSIHVHLKTQCSSSSITSKWMWLQRQAPQKHHVSVPAQPKKTTRMSAVIIFVTVTSCHHLTSTAPDHGCKTSIWQPAQNWVQRIKQILHPNFMMPSTDAAPRLSYGVRQHSKGIGNQLSQ